MMFALNALKKLLLISSLFLLVIGINACKKDTQLYDWIAPNSSSNEFVKDLWNLLVKHNESSHILDIIEQQDHLDWKSIVIRMSSDVEHNINYCIPIIQHGGVCNSFIEISLSGPKTASKIEVKRFDSETAMGMSNPNDTDRVKKVLFRLSEMGVKVPTGIVREQLLYIKEMDRKKSIEMKGIIGKTKNSNGLNAGGKVAAKPSVITCFSKVRFDFYYQFTGGYSTSPGEFTYRVMSGFRREFFSFLTRLQGVYYDENYGETNSLTFYNMMDGESTIKAMIYDALNYASHQCQFLYALDDSTMNNYFFYTGFSNCDSGPQNGGGTFTYGLSPVEEPEEAEIFNGINIEYISQNFVPTIGIIGYNEPRGNTEDMTYGTDGSTNLMPFHLRNLTDNQYFGSMTDLFNKCTTFDNSLKTVGLEMIDRFRNGNGADYSNSTLDQKVETSVQTANFLRLFGIELHHRLITGQMNINSVPVINMQTERPRYDGVYNQFHGLQILINDTEHTEIFLESFTPYPNKKWRAVVQVKILDHFGLDFHDADTYKGWHDGFPSWWILQHARNYRPFQTKISFRIQLSVT